MAAAGAAVEVIEEIGVVAEEVGGPSFVTFIQKYTPEFLKNLVGDAAKATPTVLVVDQTVKGINKVSGIIGDTIRNKFTPTQKVVTNEQQAGPSRKLETINENAENNQAKNVEYNNKIKAKLIELKTKNQHDIDELLEIFQTHKGNSEEIITKIDSFFQKTNIDRSYDDELRKYLQNPQTITYFSDAKNIEKFMDNDVLDHTVTNNELENNNSHNSSFTTEASGSQVNDRNSGGQLKPGQSTQTVGSEVSTVIDNISEEVRKHNIILKNLSIAVNVPTEVSLEEVGILERTRLHISRNFLPYTISGFAIMSFAIKTVNLATRKSGCFRFTDHTNNKSTCKVYGFCHPDNQFENDQSCSQTDLLDDQKNISCRDLPAATCQYCDATYLTAQQKNMPENVSYKCVNYTYAQAAWANYQDVLSSISTSVNFLDSILDFIGLIIRNAIPIIFVCVTGYFSILITREFRGWGVSPTPEVTKPPPKKTTKK